MLGVCAIRLMQSCRNKFSPRSRFVRVSLLVHLSCACTWEVVAAAVSHPCWRGQHLGRVILEGCRAADIGPSSSSLTDRIIYAFVPILVAYIYLAHDDSCSPEATHMSHTDYRIGGGL